MQWVRVRGGGHGGARSPSDAVLPARVLLQLESYIQDNMKKEMVEIQQNAVQNQTAVMLEIGTNLLNQTAEQTRKLTDVEAQVSNEPEHGPPGKSRRTVAMRERQRKVRAAGKTGWTEKNLRTCG